MPLATVGGQTPPPTHTIHTPYLMAHISRSATRILYTQTYIPHMGGSAHNKAARNTRATKGAGGRVTQYEIECPKSPERGEATLSSPLRECEACNASRATHYPYTYSGGYRGYVLPPRQPHCRLRRQPFSFTVQSALCGQGLPLPRFLRTRAGRQGISRCA